jgi:hypothetical protein
MKSICLASAMLCSLAVLLPAGPSGAQQQQKDGAKETPVRPTTDIAPNTQSAHEELLKYAQDMQVRIELINQTLGTLNNAPINDRSTAIKKNILTLLFEKDLATMYPRLEASAEQLRWHLHQDQAKKQSLADRRKLDVNKTQFNIDRQANDIITLEDKLDSATSEEREELELELADRKRELTEFIQWRAQQLADAQQLARQVEAFHREMVELNRLQRHIESLNKQARTRIARLVEQTEYQQIIGVSEEIEQARRTISEVMTLLQNRPPVPIAQNAPVLPTGRSAPIARPAVSPPADSEEVRLELQRARERTGKQRVKPE